MKSGQLKQVKIVSEEIRFQKKWLGLSLINYQIGGCPLQYESSYRPTKNQHKFQIDGVQIIPILKKKGQVPELVVIANFRPAVAGLIQDQNFEANAIRQLQEETGYVAESIINIPSVAMHCDPWKSSENGYLYIGIINGDSQDHFVKQELESSQNIRVHRLKLDHTITKQLDCLLKEKDYLIHSKVWTFSLGFNLHNYMPQL